MLPAIVLLCAAVQAQPADGPAAGRVTSVVLVRHAEKADDSSDPELSPGGRERALALARATADLKLDAVIVTDTKRARDTGAPAAKSRGIPLTVVPTAGGAAAHVKAVTDAVRGAAPGSAVLVVGHSNTLGPIIAALGGPEVVSLCEREFAPLYLLEVPEKGAPRLLRASYGNTDPPGSGDCHP